MKTIFRLLAFTLSLTCFTYLLLPYFKSDSISLLSFWQYLTKWGLTANLLLSLNALVNEFKPKIRVSDTLLSIALPMNMMILILYWGLYAIDPRLVNSAGPTPWYLEYYLHLVMIIFAWVEGLAFTRPFRNHTRSIIASSFVACIYIAFVELIIIPYKATYPYPFLGKLSEIQLPAFYVGVVVFMLFLLSTSKIISNKIWSTERQLEIISNNSKN
ncbi:MAG: hypothetical protein AB8G05_12160 [Oligoflexales bacterium]